MYVSMYSTYVVTALGEALSPHVDISLLVLLAGVIFMGSTGVVTVPRYPPSLKQ